MLGWSTRAGFPRQKVRRLRAEVEIALRRNRELRVEDDPELLNLLLLCSRSEEPAYHLRLEKLLRHKWLQAKRNRDPLFINLPPAGELSAFRPGRGLIALLPNNQVLSLPVGKHGTSRNIVFCRPTGGGKTNSILALNLSLSGHAIVVIFDRKGDLGCLSQFRQPGPVVVLRAERDVKLSLSEGLGLLSKEHHIAQLVALITFHLKLHASSRLLTNILHEILGANGNRRLSFSMILEKLRGIDAARTSKLGGYRDSLEFALSDLIQRSGTVLDYESSRFAESLLSGPGTFVIQTGGMPLDHCSLMASLIYRLVFERRRRTGLITPPALIEIDDALPFVTGSKSGESDGRSSPVAHWSTMGRSLGIGLVLSAQNFSLISPTIRNNGRPDSCAGRTFAPTSRSQAFLEAQSVRPVRRQVG